VKIGHRYGHQSIRPQSALVWRPVEVDQQPVDLSLIARIAANQGWSNLGLDTGKGAPNAKSSERWSAIAQINRFMGASRGSSRCDGPPRGTAC
jgi:hypothetical protein